VRAPAPAARRYADLVIRPRARRIGLLEFDQLDTALEVGRAAAREALDRAPASIVA
jgi:predicted acylesterase/phospholipase RssA